MNQVLGDGSLQRIRGYSRKRVASAALQRETERSQWLWGSLRFGGKRDSRQNRGAKRGFVGLGGFEGDPGDGERGGLEAHGGERGEKRRLRGEVSREIKRGLLGVRGVEDDDGGAYVGVNQQAAESAEHQGVVVGLGFAGAFGVDAADNAIHVLQSVVGVFSSTDARYALNDAV